MTTAEISTHQGSATATHSPKALSAILHTARRAIAALSHWAIGSILCFLSPLTALIAVGWTYRFSQRAALKYWFHRSPLKEKNGMRFPDFVATQERLHSLESWPNWLLAEKSSSRLGGLIRNVKIGVGGVMSTFLVLALPGFAMMFAWWAGWENSFSKGYEQFSVGSITSLLAILVFIVLMFYVPLAQARQAVTGESRRFFDVRTILRLTRYRWYTYLLLVGGYMVLNLPLFLAATFLGAATFDGSPLEDLTPQQGLLFLNGYFLACCMYLFAAYVALHWFGARVYASVVLSDYRKGKTPLNALSRFEKQAFDALQITTEQHQDRNVLIKTMLRGGYLTAILATAFISGLLWFSFVAQVYTTQFFAARPMVKIDGADSGGFGRWMNHPLIQLPHFKHIPEPLKEAAKKQK